jgi:hypothetical protein
MGGISALFAPPFEQTPLLEIRQNGLKEQTLNPASNEARAELAEDRIIEAGVSPNLVTNSFTPVRNEADCIGDPS